MFSPKDYIREFFHIAYQNPINRYLLDKEIKAKSKLPVTSIHKLVSNISIFSPFTNELYRQNDYYGHASIIKKYLRLKNSYQFKFTIDHGITFSKHTNQIGIDPKIPSAVTFGKYQQNNLKKFKNKIYCIGPYIHYVRRILSKEDIYRKKKENGSTLLVFPSHSTPSDTVDYNFKDFIKMIKVRNRDFKTVLVCVYWSDILRGMDKMYCEAGFNCVTAGHVYDPNFLPRLKSIISLSDYAMGNGVGSNVGYSIYLNKPYQIIWQEEKVRGHNKAVEVVENETTSKGFRHVLETLESFSSKITEKQKNIIGYYWGFDQIKSKKQLKKIVNTTETIYQKKLHG